MNEDINKKVQEIIKDIKMPLKKIKKIQNQKLQYIKHKIESIIENNIIDKNDIEKTFDELLDLLDWNFDDTKKSFYKLYEYYKKIDIEASNDYKTYYLKVIDDKKY